MPCLNVELVGRENDPYTGYGYTREPGCKVPRLLGDHGAYSLAEHLMVDAEGHQAEFPVTSIDLMADTVNRQRKAVKVGLLQSHDPMFRIDTSFSQQMHHALATFEPDIILATYRSAVPLLDAAEGYYEAKGVPIPLMDAVDVSREANCPRHGEGVDEKIEVEAERLAPILARKNVLILDEYFETGTALQRAGETAKAAGASAVRGIIGYWYRKMIVGPQAVSVDSLRRAHAGFMRSIGSMAAKTPAYDKPDAMSYEQIYDEFGDISWL